ncbi:hypothetical protein C4544_03655 [candidate division WS5 bacterium]|uniref:Glycosyltransferase RgtA/B/C/D-like domain-containing protein n=1 Tax=candidate division WS5 bacterium TaxID=2093353 RepID=A0A419DD64_9BACT|nr:MAG: hypothetical protein C4544_03655 [candidate division WS5 bacterium]
MALKGSKFYTPAAVFIASLFYYVSYANYGFIPSDWGMIVVAAERFLRGEIFYKDFSILYTPGIYLYTAVAFKYMGVSLSSATIGWSILRAFNALLIYLVGAEFVSYRTALLLPLILWFVPGDLHKGFFVFSVLISMLFLIKMISARRKWFYVFSGIVAGFLLLLRIDIFGFFIICFVFIEFAKIMIPNKHKSIIGYVEIHTSFKNIIIFGVGVLLSIFPIALYLISHDAVKEAYRQTVDYTSTMKSVWFFLPPASQLLSFDISAAYKYIGLILPFGLYFIVFILVMTIVIKRDIFENDKKLIIIFLFGCLTLNQVISYPGISRISQTLAPVLIANVYLTREYFNDRFKEYGRKVVRMNKVALIVLNVMLFTYITITCSISDPYINGSIFMRLYNRTFLPDPRLEVYTEYKYADEFNKVIDIIRNRTKNDEYVFTFPNNNQMYHFVTGRKSLEKYGIGAEYIKSEERQIKVIKLLDEKNVRVIIADLSSGQWREELAPILDRYIMKHYKPTQTAGSFTFLVKE